jgi:flagellar hook protein FlgE
MAFEIALSGLNAASADLSVTANNIANVETSGFKRSRTEFADVFSAGAQEIGNGVQLSQVSQIFSQGASDFTGNSLDLAINGQGFFTLDGASGITHTRAGAFGVDRDGYVVNAQDQRLQVYPPTGVAGGFNTGILSDLRLSTTDSAPQASTLAEYGINLPANASVPASAPLDPNDPLSYNSSTSLTIYDSLGASHTATTYFIKDAAVNTWNVETYIDGNAVGGASQLVFSNTGVLQTPANGDIVLPAYDPANGAAPIALTQDFLNSTQFGDQFAVNALSQDGYAAGRLTAIDVDNSGVVYARFTNGRSEALGKVALTNFANPQGLRQNGNSAWVETFDSGDPVRGEAGTASFGLVQAGALESSNVNLTEELVNLITAQRNFQANAQVISTADAVTQTIINLR